MKKYSILIPTNNNIHFTERCLLSLLNDLPIEGIDINEVEVTILDSNSVDGIDELVKRYRGVDLNLINCKIDNFSYKNNIGANEAQGEFIIFLNNDTEVLDNFILPMENVLQNPEIGIVSNKHYFPNMKINHVGIAFKEDRTPTHLYPGENDNLQFLFKDRVMPAVTLACAMVRKKEFIEIGGLDEDYVYGYEDVDLCLKYRKLLNKKCYVTTKSRIIHFGQSTYDRDRGENKNREIFLKKWSKENLVLYSDIYKRDRYKYYKRQRVLIENLELVPIKILRSCQTRIYREAMDKTLTEKTIVFFFSKSFSAFNVVINDLYEVFLANYSSEFKVIKDDIDNFSKYCDSEAITVTWTHFWPGYFIKTRKYSQRDFRLFAVNYECLKESKPVDFWTKHILESKFQVLAISNYCRSFLLKVGLDRKRVNVLPLGYKKEFDQYHLQPKRVNSKVHFLIFTNTNDPERYNILLSIQAFAVSFNRNKQEVSLTIKDYGGNPAYIKRYIQQYLKDYDVTLVTKFLTDRKLVQLYLRSDILLTPFRGEGFGMKILDAGAAGIPIIAPNYGGPKDFLKYCAHVEIDYGLQPIGDTLDKCALFLGNNYVDCKVDRKDLVEKIKHAFKNVKKLNIEADRKKQYIKNEYSWIAVAKQLNEIFIKKQKGKVGSRSEYGEFQISPLLEINPVKNPKVSILVNSFNRPDSIYSFLKNLKDLPDIKKVVTEIVIVDDGSDKDYLEILDKFKDSLLHIRYFRYKINRGMTFSKNLALYNSRGIISIFCGDDILPLPGFITRRIIKHEALDTKTLILGHTEWHPSIRNNLIAEFSVKYSGFQFDYENFRNKEEIELYNLYTSNISFVTSCIRDKKLYFDNIEGVKLFEDALWGQKLKDYGFRLIYDRKIEALHNHPVNYDWFVSRCELTGAVAARLFSIAPESNSFTFMEEMMNRFRSQYALYQAESSLKCKRRLIKVLEKNFTKEYLAIEKDFNNSDDFDYRRFLLMELHKRLHMIRAYYFQKGILKSLGLYKNFQILLYRIYLGEIGYSENTLHSLFDNLSYKGLVSIGIKVIKNILVDVSHRERPALKKCARRALLDSR